MRVLLAGPEEEENLSIRYLSSSLQAAGHNVDIAAFNESKALYSVTGMTPAATNRGIRQFIFHDDNFLVPSVKKIISAWMLSRMLLPTVESTT